jgi:hypothetical protein
MPEPTLNRSTLDAISAVETAKKRRKVWAYLAGHLSEMATVPEELGVHPDAVDVSEWADALEHVRQTCISKSQRDRP